MRFLLPACLLLSCAAVHAYDLGGPCLEKTDWSKESITLKDEAGKNKDWTRAVELEKTSVRNMCGNPYRWFSLANALLNAKRENEAIEVLDEMDRRGFEVKASKADSYPLVVKFLSSQQFRKSAVGKRIALKVKAAHQRKLEFITRLSKIDPRWRPSSPYIAKNACPFECCTYREWSVEKDTSLVEKPGGKKVIGKALKGTKVQGVSGEVHLDPLPINIVQDHSPFAKGDIIYVLDYMGEGHYSYWINGKPDSGEIFMEEYCLKPGPNCRAEHYLPDIQKWKTIWWVLIRLPDGTQGWTEFPENFGNKDACG